MEKLPSEVHGALDYLTGGMLVALPRAMGIRGMARTLMTGAGLVTMAYSLMTRYELGLLKLIPFKAHLGLDTMQGVMMIIAPLMLTNEDEPQQLAAMMGIGVMELGIVAMSEPNAFQDDWANHLMDQVRSDAQDRIDQARQQAQHQIENVRDRVRR